MRVALWLRALWRTQRSAGPLGAVRVEGVGVAKTLDQRIEAAVALDVASAGEGDWLGGSRPDRSQDCRWGTALEPNPEFVVDGVTEGHNYEMSDGKGEPVRVQVLWRLRNWVALED